MKFFIFFLILFFSIPSFSKENPSFYRAKVKHFSKRNNGISPDGTTIYEYITGTYQVKNNSISIGDVKVDPKSNNKKLNIYNRLENVDIFGKKMLSKYKTKVLEKRDKNSTISKIGEINLKDKDKKRVKNIYIYGKDIKIKVK